VVAAILMMNLLRQYSPFLVILIVFFNIFFAGFCIKKKIINENVINYQKIYTNDLTTQKSESLVFGIKRWFLSV